MLNKDGVRELAYVVTIDNIEPIPGYDRVEWATVGGWKVIVQKGQFNIGDPAIYFEIDSKVPSDKECFAFLEKRHYKVKTLKMCKVISQGLLMHATDFGWGVTESGGIYDGNETHYPEDESRFLTEKLGVTYADAEDNQRKAPSADKYKKMAQRHPAIFRKPFVRWLMKRKWGKNLMFFFFGKKKDKKNGWPEWVSKTDEERVQNMPWILNDTGEWVVTEKIDGSSTTFTMKRGKRGKNEFYVCSRNVCFDSVDKPCYYDTNIYWEMAQKYDMYNALSKFLEDHPQCDWVTVQGETYGAGVQRRDYSMEDHDFRAFNLVTSDRGRWGTFEMIDELTIPYGIFCVPTYFGGPVTFDTLFGDAEDRMAKILEMATGDSQLDKKPREGFVLRSVDGQKSFKAVSNEFLLKYHG
jgi:hypothetical protein